MSTENLKQKTFGGFIWMFLERIGAQVVTFVVSLVLARILIPNDYGIVSLALIFINLANIFVVQGLNAALIQRKNVSDVEYSTAFFTNLAISIVLYVIIFIFSPFVAQYYGLEKLTPIFRVLSLRLPIGAINSIQRAYVSRNLLFKKFFFSTLGGTIVSAFVGIGMAMYGLGPWAIVGQYLTNSTIDTIVLWITVNWRPKRLFSFKNLKEMFSFSWKVFAAAFLNEVYLELRSLIIGKKYSSEDLAFYNRGKQFPQLFYTNVASAITSVMFPVMSMKKDDNVSLKRNLTSVISTSCYVLFPLMVGLAMVSRPLVEIILTEKWLPCVPFLQAYCISYAILPLQSIQEQLYKAKGRSDIVLILFFIEKIVGIAIILFTMSISVWAIAVGMVVTAFISTIVHTIPMKSVINYSFWDLIKDLAPNVIFSGSMALVVFLVGMLPAIQIVVLVLQIVIGMVWYFLISLAFKSTSLKSLLELINSKLQIKCINHLISWFYK